MTKEQVKYVKENGPTPGYEIGERNSGHDRLFSFKPPVKNIPKSKKYGGTKRIIYYLEEQDKEDVVERWIKENKEAFDGMGEWPFYLRVCMHHPNFKEAAREALGGVNPGGSTKGMKLGGECSLCGDEYTGSLAKHLEKDH